MRSGRCSRASVERFQAVAGLQRLVAVGVEQVVEELHVELVVLDDQDRLGHRLRLRRFDRPMMGDLGPIRHGAESGSHPPKHPSRSLR